jgi:hypothetical protein
MRKLIPAMLFVCCQNFFCALAMAQTGNTASHELEANDLFTTDDVLELTLSGDVNAVLKDRATGLKYHQLTLSYKPKDKEEISFPVDVKTRGHFRRLKSNCVYPPLLINFSKSESLKSSLFKGQDKLKLVMPCRGDEYLIREWLVYKIYNLVTPESFKCRLVKVKLEPADSKKTTVPFYGLLLEEEKQMAKRNQQIIVTKKIRPDQTYEDAFLKMAVFEYLIGNTDWSIEFLQNIKLIADSENALLPVPVPYDFDHAGIVNTPYAMPQEDLLLTSIKERRYRGYCVSDLKVFDSTIALFNSIKDELYNTYINCSLLSSGYIKSTVKYLDDFYYTINNKAAMKRAFTYPCDPNGTGNIIIKGLRKD